MPTWPAVVSFLAAALPTTLAFAALAFPRRAAQATAGAAGGALFWALAVTLGPPITPAEANIRVDVPAICLLLLVCALGAVVVRYSLTYLRGVPDLDRYLRAMLLTLSSVTMLVIADSVLVLALAWTGTSLALHQLLTFYPHRTAALMAAHKKFLLSRLADACVAACVALIYLEVGSFDLDVIARWTSARAELPTSMHVAAVFFAVAVVLRSAQLPFHGWLMQVMEAPTPVSALLHAGVVNIGGFVLITLAPLFDRAESARLLLLCVGLFSTVVAALVMTTRVSVKVALAWSTCAQMGFLLVQCGLGLWPLALLHIVAHSLYKAHAFLRAGSAVDDWKVRHMAPPARQPSALRSAAALVLGVGIALAGFALLRAAWRQPLMMDASSWLSIALVGAGVSSLFAAPVALGARRVGALAARAGAVLLLYAGAHALADQVMPASSVAPSTAAWSLVGLGFVTLFVLKTSLQVRPAGRFARAIHPWLFAGLYLDETFTRLAFRLWPPRLDAPSRSRAAGQMPETIEVRA